MPDSITFLGTSDGLPSPDRLHASILVRLAGKTILLDAGEPCSHTLKHRGESFDDIDAIFITHPHSDHVGGLPMLLQSMWLEKRRQPLTVFMPEILIAPFRQWIGHCLLNESRFNFKIHWNPIRPVMRVSKLTVRSFENSHLSRSRSFCLLVEGGGKRIGYSGDIGSVTDLEPLLPVDVLITELAHPSPSEMLHWLKDKPVGKVLITHVGRGVTRRSAGRIRFVKDGDRITLVGADTGRRR